MKKIGNRRLGWFAASLASACVGHLHSQVPDFHLVASSENSQLGSGFAALGDVDGDGVPDLAVADRSARVGSFSSSGVVYVVSGADGSVLRSHTGEPAAALYFGSSMVALNADGDGVPDLAIGAPGQANASGYGAGSVSVYSGADGSLLFSVTGPDRSQAGSSLANAGDQDGDGFDDLFTGAPRGNGSRGMVLKLSGSDGAELGSFLSSSSVSEFGVTLVSVDDIDGDGLKDLAVGSPGFSRSVGRVQLIGGVDGLIKSEISGTSFFNRIGQSLANAADGNGDGVPDLLIGSYSGGNALLVSGVDLATLEDLSIPLPLYRPLVVGGTMDYDADGIEDWLLGSNALGVNDGGEVVGGVRVVSGADRSTLVEYAATEPFTGLGGSLATLPGIGFAVGETNLLNSVTSGYGAAYVWLLVRDSDGDGVIDSEDDNPYSVNDPTVRILGLDTGVANTVDANGITLADRFAEIGDLSSYENEAGYFVEIVHLSNQLAKEGLLDRGQANKIQAAGRQGSVQTKRNGKNR